MTRAIPERSPSSWRESTSSRRANRWQPPRSTDRNRYAIREPNVFLPDSHSGGRLDGGRNALGLGWSLHQGTGAPRAGRLPAGMRQMPWGEPVGRGSLSTLGGRGFPAELERQDRRSAL